MAKPTSPTTALTSSLELAATCSEVRTCQAMGMAIHPAGRFLSWSRLPPTAAVDHVQPLSMRTASPPLHISESSVRPRDPRMAPYSAAAMAMHRTLSTIAIQKTFLEIRPVGGVTRALKPSHNGFPVRLTVALAGLSDGYVEQFGASALKSTASASVRLASLLGWRSLWVSRPGSDHFALRTYLRSRARRTPKQRPAA